MFRISHLNAGLAQLRPFSHILFFKNELMCGFKILCLEFQFQEVKFTKLSIKDITINS